MEEKKNNKGLILLICILIILVLGLVGFIVYDKVLKIDKNIPNNGDNTTITTSTLLTTEKQEIPKYKVSEIFENYPTKNDDTVIAKGFFEELIDNNINHRSIYENKKSKFIGTDIEFIYNSKKCDFEEENVTDEIVNKYYWCEDIDISIDNNYVFTITEYAKGISYTSPYILINNKYIVVQYDRYLGDGKGYIKIYNLNGNLIKEINNTGYSGTLPTPENVDSYNEYSFDDKYVILNNDKLYYVSHSNVYFSEDDTNNASINYLDLNTMEEKVLKEFKAIFSQQY